MIPKVYDLRVMSIFVPDPDHASVIIMRGPPGEPHYVAKKEDTGLGDTSVGGTVQGTAKYSNVWKNHDAQAFQGEEGQRTRNKIVRELLKHTESMGAYLLYVAETYQACTDHMPEYRLLDAFETRRLFNLLMSFNQDGTVFPSELFDADIKRGGMAEGNWFLMDCLDGLYDLMSMFKKKIPKGDTRALKVLQYAERVPETTAELGRILAVDGFFGNNDRASYQPQTGKLDALNTGNIFFVARELGGGSLAAHYTGIDFFDKSVLSMYNFLKPLTQDQLENTWWGHLLAASKQTQKEAISYYLDRINLYLTNHNHRGFYGSEHKKYCLEGFREGASRLKKSLGKQKNKLAGIKDRKHRLGW